MRGRFVLAALATVGMSLALAASAGAYDRAHELSNYQRIGQRFVNDQASVAYQAAVARAGVDGTVDILVRDAQSRGQRFSGSLCGSGVYACAGDPRMYDWDGAKGQVTPVLYRNRNGAHIEGHVWIGKRWLGAPAGSLPGVVIETGSIQAPERWYLWIAQVLANHGYEVLTFDVQGQGRSDLLGSHDAQHAFQGVPAQDIDHFVEDLEDAIAFFHSDANPGAALLDRDRLGIIGHSLGASAVSIVQATDLRVDAAVAWDNVSSSVTPRVPMLGMSADYGLTPTPYMSDPARSGKSAGFGAWKAAGVDAMEVVVRGGTHYEWSYAPDLLPASERGIDVAAWYTTAWLDRYVKEDPSADARLLTDRWRADPVDAALDPGEGGNLFSFYFDSPLALRLSDGTPVACADLRAGCPLLSDDGVPRTPAYSFLADRG